jgi:hypothetical protein
MKVYFIYNSKEDRLLKVGTKMFAGYKSRKTAESVLKAKPTSALGHHVFGPGKYEWVEHKREDYKIVEVELK